ncbi:MAG: type I-F CRISPR-associated helicase Cas3, partial [Chlamydiia bacterium]|nr:type I-F CRISPR-associated helicase Cas3 [Chlamydiia bacterium]
LSQDSKRCRFSVALGLCSLTLQTGEAIKERLGTHSEDVAVLIGSRAFQELYEQRTSDEISTGSESEEDLFEDAFYIRYEGALGDGPFSRWLKQKPKLNQLVSAPILVSTIDYLVPATEGARGGKQIAPMLRLLSSDLVLDEPDDFGLEDLPALCRLVNWAGMLGSRVLLSSATMPPALALALYEAYQSGRNAYNHSRGLERLAKPVPCLWVDEFRSVVHEPTGSEDFKCLHVAFVDKRVAKLTENEKPARRGAVVPIEKMPSTKGSLSEAAAIVAEAVHKEMLSLHDEHHEKDPVSGKKVSFGLVRMANINPMVAMVRSLLHHSLPDGVRVHFCVYHSQFPLIMRSAIESKIDVALDRRDPQAIWRNPTIKRALDQHPEENHLFVVFGTAVTEVGRDHDYDWAIAEPSSMRSLIQLAGRLQRHRQREPGTANLRILDRNVRALRSRDVCFTKPGFESEGDFSLASHKVSDLLNPDQYQVLNAIPRIQVDPDLSPTQILVALEHAHLEARLFEGVCPQYAALWWKHNPAWSFEFQRRTPFRHSRPQDTFILMKEEFGDAFHWHRVLRDSGLQACEGRFNRAELSFANGFSPWVSMDVYELLDALTSTEAEECDQTEWIRLCWRFTPVQLAPYEDLGERRFDFHPLLGVYLED